MQKHILVLASQMCNQSIFPCITKYWEYCTTGWIKHFDGVNMISEKL